MARIKIYLSYDGTRYRGWQRQANTKHTIQEVLEMKLSVLANQRVSVMASGRTDAGVHARIQVAHAEMPDALVARLLPNGRFVQSLNSLLPEDIRVLLVEEVPRTFHAQRDVVKKTYVYFVNATPVQWPELRNHTWHLRFPLDWAAVEQATKALIGTHDFKALCAADTTAKTSVRTIEEAYWGSVSWHGIGGFHELRAFRVTGTGFLKHMVRSMVGTLVHIGMGKAKPELVSYLLETQDRHMAGPTAPARGLWLWDILYLT